MDPLTSEIDMDEKCSKCGKKGVCPNGLCLKCVTDLYIRKLYAGKDKRKNVDGKL